MPLCHQRGTWLLARCEPHHSACLVWQQTEPLQPHSEAAELRGAQVQVPACLQHGDAQAGAQVTGVLSGEEQALLSELTSPAGECFDAWS